MTSFRLSIVISFPKNYPALYLHSRFLVQHASSQCHIIANNMTPYVIFYHFFQKIVLFNTGILDNRKITSRLNPNSPITTIGIEMTAGKNSVSRPIHPATIRKNG